MNADRCSRRACLGTLAAATLALGGCAGSAPRRADDAVSPDAASHGLRVESLRLTAADNLLDLRFRITDASRAAPFLSRKAELQLVDPASGARFAVPNTPKLGKLRQVPRADSAGHSYFVLFANPGRFLQRGSRVDLLAGDVTIARLTVQ